VIIVLFALFAGKLEKSSVEKIDVSQQTTQDYSVMISNPPANVTDPENYKAFFSQFNGEIVFISVALNNGELIKKIADRKVIESILQGLMLQADEQIRNSGSITESKYEDLPLSFLQKVGFAPTIPKCLKKMKELTEDINKLEKCEYEAWRVYCTFNSEYDQREFLRRTNIGKLEVMKNNSNSAEITMQGKTLEVKEAPEPGDIIYDNSHVSFAKMFLSWVFSYIFCFVLLVASFFLINVSLLFVL
jgi:hypothetical protein